MGIVIVENGRCKWGHGQIVEFSSLVTFDLHYKPIKIFLFKKSSYVVDVDFSVFRVEIKQLF